MPVAAVAAVVGATAAVVGTAASISSANKQRKLQKQQFLFERQVQQNRSAKSRRDTIRAGRVAQANLVQQAENTGGSLTSAALGGIGSIQSQINANISFLDTNQKLTDQAAVVAGRALNAGAKADLYSSAAGLGAKVFSAAGGTSAFG